MLLHAWRSILLTEEGLTVIPVQLSMAFKPHLDQQRNAVKASHAEHRHNSVNM